MRHYLDKNDPKIQAILEELKTTILKKFPNTTFEIEEGGDIEGIFLNAITDIDDTERILDLVIDRIYELQVEQGLPIHVLPLLTPERNAKLWKEQHPQQQPL